MKSKNPGVGVLRDLYVEKQLTLEQIGQKYGVTGVSVLMWMKQVGIPRRNRGGWKGKARPKQACGPGREVLYELYVVKVWTLARIADQYGVTPAAVIYWMKVVGIPRRPAGGWSKGMTGLKGHPAHNKGKPWSDELRAKHMATRSTPEYREKLAAQKRGEKSYLWRGGNYESRSPRGWEWRQLRQEIYDRDRWTCQSCGVLCMNSKQAKLHPGCRIQCHHKVPRRFGGTDGPSNLITLCLKCHSREEGLTLARYLSQYTGFKKTVVKGNTTIVQGPAGPVVQSLSDPVIAYFQQAGCTEWERQAALEKFHFKAIGEGEDPVRRVSAYDTDQEAERNAWSPETKRQIEALLDAQQGPEYFRIERPRRPAPWPTYDELAAQGRRTVEMVAEKITDTVREMGYDPAEVIAYERENLSRTAVLQSLQALLLPEPEQEILVEA